MTTTATTPEPGKHPMIERDDRVNWSTLKFMRTSAKHYIHRLEHPRPDTDALALGRVAHCAVYEPDQLDLRYVVMPNFHGGMNDDTARDKGYAGGKQAKAAWLANVGDAEIVDAGLHGRALACRDAILRSPQTAPMVTGGFSEQRIEWTDDETGIECRARVDHVNGSLSDLKTTRSVELHSFNRDVGTYGYHGQIAFYLDGLRANGIDTAEPPAIIAVESSPPHDELVLEFTADDIRAGRRLYRYCLQRLAECRASGEWPGVSGGRRRRVAIPEWSIPEGGTITFGGMALFQAPAIEGD